MIFFTYADIQILKPKRYKRRKEINIHNKAIQT